MEYCLGADDGAATMWDRGSDLDLDGDGRLDAVSLDIDHDGLADDALVDLDGDGIADHAVLDVNGADERYVTDDGTGTWSVAAEHPARTASGLRWFGLDGVEHTGGPLSDFGADGVRFTDSNGDGIADRALLTGADGAIGYVDIDGDGRWDVKLTDADGDGTADSAGALTPRT